MNDKLTKLLLLLIAVGLFCNAAAMLINTMITPAYAADSRVYVDGGNITVRLETSRDIPVKIEDFPAYDKLLVKIEDTVPIQQR